MTWRMTKRTAAILTATALGAAALTVLPQGGSGNGGAAVAQARSAKTIGPGLGFSKAAPTGVEFKLPPGLTLESPIVAWSPENPVDCDEKYSDESYGTGDEVRACLIFHNSTNAPITVTLPPGLLLVATNDDVQNGIIVQTTTIVVPAGERYFAPLFAYCANEDRSTTGLDDRYELGPVIQQPQFHELYALLEGKTLTREAAGYVQGAIDDITQGKGLTPARRAVLQSL